MSEYQTQKVRGDHERDIQEEFNRQQSHAQGGVPAGQETDGVDCPQCYYDKPEEQTTAECPQCHYEREVAQGEEVETECPQCHYKGRVVEKVHKKGSPQGFYGSR